MRVLISGGGVAGTVTALALQRAGIESTIFEAHEPSSGDVGSYLTISPNGLDALDAVGVLPLVKQVGLPTRRRLPKVRCRWFQPFTALRRSSRIRCWRPR